MRLLVQDGAKLNVKDERMIMPLLLAGRAINGDRDEEITKFIEIVRVLVDANVFVNIIHPDTGIN